MFATHSPRWRRISVALSAALTAAALATASPASAELFPSPGSTQTCIGVQGGWLIKVNGFGSSFEPNATGTTTFVLANGDVYEFTATTTDEGIFHTEAFFLDMRDPEMAALVGTDIFQTATYGPVTESFSYELVGCPTAPDSRAGCLDGGFSSYPALGFLNQGDCVSWIATNGKNEPGQNLP
jgi:hypothetical protein